MNGGGKITLSQSFKLYRKLKGEGIFTGNELKSSDHVLIYKRDGTIEGVVPLEQAGDDIEVTEGIISPGLINCHCHLELSHLKGRIPEGTGLINFVQSVMGSRFAANAEEKTEAIAKADDEMYNKGIVAIGDICNSADTIEIKKNSRLYYHSFIEVSGFVAEGAETRFESGIQLKDAFAAEGLKATISPHAPYSVCKELFSLINENTKDEIITIHNQETDAENTLFKSRSGDLLKLYNNMGINIDSFKPTGLSSLKSWTNFFNKGQKIIAVHNTFTEKDDLTISAQIFYCICINANIYIEKTIPPVGIFNSDKIILGTDSYASNHQLDIIEELKMIMQKFPEVKLDEALKWATSNGARALGIDKSYGYFSKGMKPGITILDGVSGGKLSTSSSSRRFL